MPADADPIEPWVIRTRERIGDRIRSLRRSQGITQDALCEAVGVERKTISRWENGHHPMDIDDAARIARALAVPLAWLFGDDWTHAGTECDTPAAGNDKPAPAVPPERPGRTPDE